MKRPPKKNEGRGFFTRQRPRDDDREPQRRRDSRDDRDGRDDDRRGRRPGTDDRSYDRRRAGQDVRDESPERDFYDDRDERDVRRRKPDDDRDESDGRQLPVRRSMAEVIDEVRQAEEKTAQALAQPLGDLAKAFAMQAEMLKSVHETQQRLTKAIEDDTRNEVMLNSTNALNETFRGVRSVQQGLIEKLETSSRGNRLWRAAAIILLVVGIGGGAWGVQAFVRYIGERDSAIDEKVDGLKNSVAARANALLDEALAEKARAREELIRGNGDLESLRKEALTLSSEKAAAERDLAHTKTKVTEYEAAIAAKDKELDETKRRVERLEAESRDTLKRLEDARAEVDRLHTEVIDRLRSGERLPPEMLEQKGREKPIVPEVAAASIGKPENPAKEGPAPSAPADTEVVVGPPANVSGAADPKANAKTEAKANTNGEAPAVPSEPQKKDGSVDAGDLRESSKAEARGRAVAVLNKLLEKHRSNHDYRVESIGGFAKDGAIEDAVVSESIPGRGVAKRISAKRLLFNVSPQGDIVDLNFEDGGVSTLGTDGRMSDPAAFYNQKYRISVLCLNGPDWLRAKESFITTK